MGIKVKMSETLQHFTGIKDVAEVNGSTVAQCLDDLVYQFPSAKKWLFDKDCKWLSNVGIFVNRESLNPEELAKPVRDGDELLIIHIILPGG
jgi:molybdopterin converting factor small subunit